MRKINGTSLIALRDHLSAQLLRNGAESLQRQLYRLLRAAMLDGRLRAGERLPATRLLAQELGLARNTVLLAYQQLVAEGFCHSRAGAATEVAQLQPELPTRPPAATAIQAAPALLAKRAQEVLDGLSQRQGTQHALLQPGLPDLSAFPWPIWRKLLQARLAQQSPLDMGYRNEGGHPELRQALARYLSLSRGVRCSAEQIVVCGAMQQALDLLARSLADPGEVVWMEEPGYSGARVAWQMAGLQLQPVPVDAQGMAWQQQSLPPPKLVYLSPSHQYPLGAVMSLPRRQALLAEVARQQAWLIEDDYDSEFRHQGKPLAALQGLDGGQRVIYLGTFSKVMFPSLRLGYMVLPPPLVQPIRQLQARLYREGDYASQAALADFIALGHFDSHLRRMRRHYAARQLVLRQALQRQFGQRFPLYGGEAGMHLVLQLPPGSDAPAIAQQLASHGLGIPPLDAYCLQAPPFPGLVIGYAAGDQLAFQLGVHKLVTVLAGLAG